MEKNFKPTLCKGNIVIPEYGTMENALVYLRLEADICFRRERRKRCLAIAKMCWERRWRPEFDYAFWHKWGKRWFEIADLFAKPVEEKPAAKRYKDVEIGDVIDGVKITDVEEESGHLTFTFDIIGGGWSFLVIYPCDYDKEAKFTFPDDTEEKENGQTDFLNELAEG